MSNPISIEPPDALPNVLQEDTPDVMSAALPAAFPAEPVIERVIERVEQLLVRHEALQRTNALLNEEVSALTDERDSLRSRLSAARARVDALLERLPENALTNSRASAGADS